MDMIDAIAQSIATMEGFFKPNTIAQRNNNPGNLRSWGSNPIKNGYAAFPTAEAGWAALRRQVQLNVSKGLTLTEFFGGKPGVYPGYAPAADANDPNGYAAFVAGKTGIPANQPITSFLAAGNSRSTPSWPEDSNGPSWPELPEAGWAESELLIYGAIAAIVIATAWLLVD